MSIGILALVFAGVGGLICMVEYVHPQEEKRTQAHVFDYSAVMPKEL